MMILGRHSASTVLEMLGKVSPHLMFALRASCLRVIEVSTAVATHETVLSTTEAQRTSVTLSIGIVTGHTLAMARKFNFTTDA